MSKCADVISVPDGGKDHRERVSQKAHRGLAELSHSDSSVLLVPPRAALGLLCYVLIDYSVRLLVPSYVQILIALPNYALCFILPLTLPHSRLNEVANLGQLESENV